MHTYELYAIIYVTFKLEEFAYMLNNKNAKYKRKYKPNNLIYIIILFVFVIIRFVSMLIDLKEISNALNDLAIGGIASDIVAWLIDVSNCNKKNKELEEKERLIFSDYIRAINDLARFIATRCKDFTSEFDEYNLKIWLDKMSNEDNYANVEYPRIKLIRIYFHIKIFTQNVKCTLTALQRQYCILIESDVVDTDDFLQHISIQLRICDEICDNIELYNDDNCKMSKIVNTKIIELYNNANTFSTNNLPEKFSWHTNG